MLSVGRKILIFQEGYMQYFRGNLSRVKKLIQERLPDEQDLYGYPGVSKNLLINAVDLAYQLSQEIEENDTDDGVKFEIISLKRFGSQANDELKKYLEDDTKYKSSATRNFNDFLNHLSQLIEKTKQVYFIVNKNGLRDDIELAVIRETISNLKKESEQYTAILNDLSDTAESTRLLVDEIKGTHSLGEKIKNEMTDWRASTEKSFTSINTTHEKIDGWEDNIQEKDANFRTLSQLIEKLSASANELKDKLVLHVNKSEESAIALKQYEEKNKELQDEIEKTLGDANRIGMAASFRERKEELAKTQTKWQNIFILTVLSIVCFSSYFIVPQVTSGSFVWEHVLIEITVIAPLIWLAWFAARQFNYINRVREDYSFKYASSMAYEGYKKATREIDPALEKLLMEFSLYNMALNPIRLYNKKADHSTPVSELADAILSRLSNLKKVTCEAPNFGKFTAYMENAIEKEIEPE
jgi:hypothetical protein